jgi:diadenosine tetraphosphate (Ap4A) HIT family hydrolase
MMVFSREHYISFAHMPLDLFGELEQISKELIAELSESVATPIVFEHGPMSDEASGGACTDHAHLHFVPVGRVDLKPVIDERLRVHLGPDCEARPLAGLEQLRTEAEREVPYIMYQDQDDTRWIYDVEDELPCQFLRRTVGEALGVGGEWDWVGCPRKEVFNETMELFDAEPVFELD